MENKVKTADEMLKEQGFISVQHYEEEYCEDFRHWLANKNVVGYKNKYGVIIIFDANGKNIYQFMIAKCEMISLQINYALLLAIKAKMEELQKGE